jgi:HSP20 family molecular chaperone IbpA
MAIGNSAMLDLPRLDRAIEESIDPILELICDVERQIRERAYAIYLQDPAAGTEIDHWLRAERELLWKPPVDLVEKDGAYVLETAVPGMSRKDLDVRVGRDRVVVRGRKQQKHTRHEGKVHLCECTSGEIFRNVALPGAVDGAKAKIDVADGILRVTMPIRKPAPAKET